MAALEGFLLSGMAADLILFIVVLECAALLLWQFGGGGGKGGNGKRVPLGRWLSPLGAGAALVLALRFALTDTGALPIAGALAVAGLAHLAGYRHRWRP